MSTKAIRVHTATDGSYLYERSFRGVVRAIEVQIGDLSTPDVAITDGVYATSVYSGTGLAVDTKSGLLNVVVMGTLKVAVTGAGSLKRGWVNVLVET
jgi:hypothetical protein